MWCGVISSGPIEEGDDVTVGCYAQFDWQSYMLQYRHIVTINATLQFLEDRDSRISLTPSLTCHPGPPPSEIMTTTYTIHNVQPGDDITAECWISFTFDRSRAFSGRNLYAINQLDYTCRVSSTGDFGYYAINFCTANVYRSAWYRELANT